MFCGSEAQRVQFSLDLMLQLGFRFTAVQGSSFSMLRPRSLVLAEGTFVPGIQKAALSLESSPAEPEAGPGSSVPRAGVSLLPPSLTFPGFELSLAFLTVFDEGFVFPSQG